MKLLFKSPKKLDFQLPQKIFDQNCQTRSWKVQLAEKIPQVIIPKGALIHA